MLRRAFCAAAFMVAVAGVASAEEFAVTIRKIDGGKVTFTRVVLGQPEKGREEFTLPVADKAKVYRLERKADEKKKAKLARGAELPDGLKDAGLKKALAGVKTRLDTGVPARLVTDAGGKEIKEVQVLLPKAKLGP